MKIFNLNSDEWDRTEEREGWRIKDAWVGARGGHFNLLNFRKRQWNPGQVAAGIEPLRQPYDLRHTYATFALRAGVSILDLSRFMGASLAMIDCH